MKKSILTITAATLAVTVNAASVVFPGPAPEKAVAKISKKEDSFTLSNNVIAVSWKIKGGELFLSSITNKLNSKSYSQSDSPAFRIKTSEGKDFITDWKVITPPAISQLKIDKNSPSNGKHYGGKAITAIFKSPGSGITLKWQGELRNDAAYARTTVELISTDNSEKHITRVELFSKVKLTSPTLFPQKKGSPIIDSSGNIFCGMEVPFFTSAIHGDDFTSGFNCNLKIGNGVKYSFATVIAIFAKGQLRRSMLHYIERERVRSYRQFLHYNCWFDLCRNVSEKGMANRMDTIYNELGKKRGVLLDAYVVDDGYDDWDHGFWTFNKKKFPNGFAGLKNKLKEVKSNLGVWLSPAGGYGSQRNQRIKRAAEMGIKSFDLSVPIYNKWFLEKMTRFIKDDNMVYFKWDRLGNGVSNHFMALMKIAEKLRKLKPELFLNTTVGTWQSPFWLQQVDCTWRQGNDMGFIGDGDKRDQWLTYRDAISYKAMGTSNFIYPLNALMNHGIVFANGHPFGNTAQKGSHDMRNDVRIYFAGGCALQELYITPDILKAPQWDAIAESAKWAKKNADILVDAHFIGGDPKKLEIYGFAAWQKNKGTVALRNPKKTSQSFKLDIAKIFELPNGAKKKYILKSPYGDQRIKKLRLEAGKPVKLKMEPFEVLVFDAK